MDARPLFPASLISAEAASSLPGFTIRPLDKGDYARGFLECLRDLAPMGNLSADEFNERYDELDTRGRGPYYYVVVEHQGRIVATGAVIVENKFIENRAVVGHVEEVCVAKDYQGRGLGARGAPCPRLGGARRRLHQVDPYLQPGERGILRQVRVQEHFGHGDEHRFVPQG